jgi:hypothetical protein
MSCKDFDGLIDKMGTLVANQSERTTKPNQNDFINELSYDYNLIDPQCLCLHSFRYIIDNNQNVFVVMWMTHGLNGAKKSKPHFMNGLVGNKVINFTIGVCKRFPICWQTS